tara:strand:- start:421 stop:1104 length:684 start_codon:yes stop_codon:yes gene_type:complete
VIVAALAAAIALPSGCATQGAASGASTEGADPSALIELYAGAFTDPPRDGPAAVSGKDFWYISCGQAFALCNSASTEFDEAAASLGWDVTVFDGEANPATAGAGIDQAIAAGADGIALTAYDRDSITGALQQAQAAGVPVVAALTLGCEGEPLFTAAVNHAGTSDFCEFNEACGGYKELYTAATGSGAAIIDLHEASQTLQRCAHDGFLAGIEEGDTCASPLMCRGP